MRKIKYIFIILFSFLISSNSSSDELNILFLKLKNAKSFSEAIKVEKKIWNIWVTNGSNKKK